MWVTLPAGTDVARLFEAAAELGVAFVKGTDFLLEGGENTLRLAYSGVTPEQIDEGVHAPRRGLPLALTLSGRSAGRAPADPAAPCARGGEGSAITETVSATLAVTTQRLPSAACTTTCSSSRSTSLPSSPGSRPESLR